MHSQSCDGSLVTFDLVLISFIDHFDSISTLFLIDLVCFEQLLLMDQLFTQVVLSDLSSMYDLCLCFAQHGAVLLFSFTC